MATNLLTTLQRVFSVTEHLELEFSRIQLCLVDSLFIWNVTQHTLLPLDFEFLFAQIRICLALQSLWRWWFTSGSTIGTIPAAWQVAAYLMLRVCFVTRWEWPTLAIFDRNNDTIGVDAMRTICDNANNISKATNLASTLAFSAIASGLGVFFPILLY